MHRLMKKAVVALAAAAVVLPLSTAAQITPWYNWTLAPPEVADHIGDRRRQSGQAAGGVCGDLSGIPVHLRSAEGLRIARRGDRAFPGGTGLGR